MTPDSLHNDRAMPGLTRPCRKRTSAPSEPRGSTSQDSTRTQNISASLVIGSLFNAWDAWRSFLFGTFPCFKKASQCNPVIVPFWLSRILLFPTQMRVFVSNRVNGMTHFFDAHLFSTCVGCKNCALLASRSDEASAGKFHCSDTSPQIVS